MTEEWRDSHYKFYGTGERCFVFSIDRDLNKGKLESENINVYEPTLNNNKYQMSDDKCITIGSSQNGRSAIYISKDFNDAYTSENETFNNPQLTKTRDVKVKKFEVWSFDEL